MDVLNGIRVVDFTRTHGGSLGTMNLCDFGAEVIKVESHRSSPSSESEAKLFCYMNRGKKSIKLNPENPEDKRILVSLFENTDVICEDLPYGYLDQLGLGAETICKQFPHIIYVSVSAFGRTGEWKEKIADDSQLEAMSGLTDMTGFKDGFPIKTGTSTAAYFTAGYMVSGIMLALIHRENTKKGQFLDISILDSLITSLEMGLASYSVTGCAPERKGNAGISISPYDTFRCKDGYVAIGVSTNQQWENFCHAIHRPELISNPRYDTNQKRKNLHVTEITPIVEAYTMIRTKKEIENILKSVGIPCAGVYTVYEAMYSEQTKIREMLVPMKDSNLGTFSTPGIIVKLSQTPGKIRNGAPSCGENTKEFINI